MEQKIQRRKNAASSACVQLLCLCLIIAQLPHAAGREVYRNKDDRRRAWLSPQKQQRIKQIIQRADSTDGHARLEGGQ